MRMKNSRALLAIAVSLLFAACAVTPPAAVPEEHIARREGVSSSFGSAPPDRPGLGTKWGEKRNSLVGTVSFERANFNHPLPAAAIYYNDEAGIRAMAGRSRGSAGFRFCPTQPQRW